MFLFAILLLIAIICTIVIIALASVGGSVILLVFGDVIVCIGLIIWILVRRFQD